MREVLPVLGLYGAIILVSVLLLGGIFLGGRWRAEKQHELPDVPPAKPGEAPARPPSEAITLRLEPDGKVSIEMEGQRFNRIDDIGEDRLVARVLAAVNGMQQFAGLKPEPKLAPSALTDELRAGHTPADGALLIEFRGQRYRRLIDIRDGETGRQLLSVIGELVAFAQGKVLPAESPARTDKPSVQPEDEFLKRLTTPEAAPAPLKMPTLMEAVRRPSSKPAPMPMGIAGQIDQVLQEQLVDNVALQGRTVHVITAPDGSLAIEVEGRVSRWPDDVTDSVVCEAVQRAIRTWERM